MLGVLPVFAACAPFGPDFGLGGASSSSSSGIGTPVTQGPPDVRAKDLLMNAVTSASIMSAGGGFADFTPASGSQFGPALKLTGDRRRASGS